MKTFRIEDIQDDAVRENFQKLLEEFKSMPFFRGDFTFVSIPIKAAVTNYRWQHKLVFSPKDVIVTSVISPTNAAVTVTFNYSKFDKTYLDITTTGACTIRAYVGCYLEGSNA